MVSCCVVVFSDCFKGFKKFGLGVASSMLFFKPLLIFYSLYLQIFLENLQRNPKAPDFKHKDTGEALWIEGRYTPQWVSSQLEILDARMGSNAGHSARMPVNMVAADEIFSF